MKIKKITIDQNQRKAIVESAGKDSGLTLEAINTISDFIETSMNTKVIEVAKVIRSEAVKHYSSKYKTLATEAVKRNNSRNLKKLDLYLSEAVSSWHKKNSLAVETSIVQVRNKKLVEGMLNLFESNFFNIPEGKEDMMKQLGRYAARMEKVSEEKSEKLRELSSRFVSLKKNAIAEAASRGLTDTQREKLQNHSKNIKAKTLDEFRSQLIEARKAIIDQKPIIESGEKTVKVTLTESKPTRSFAPTDDLIERSSAVLGR